MRKMNFVSMILAAGFSGGLLVSVLTHLIYTARYPRVIEDGQYGMIFMGTVPLGWLLGSAIGTIVAWRVSARPHLAGLVAGLLVVGGVVAGPLVGVAGVMAAGCVWLLFHPHG